MKKVSGKKLCKILGKKGWMLARVTSAHHIFLMRGCNIRITVPVHGNSDLKFGLQHAIMKLAHIDEDEL